MSYEKKTLPKIAKSSILKIILFLVVFYSHSVFAVGPGGIDSGLQVWLKANTLTETNGDVVNNWTDQSVNSYTATKIGSPVFSDSSAEWINFNPTVKFDGNSIFKVSGGLAHGNTYSDVYAFLVNKHNSVRIAQFSFLETGDGGATRIGTHLPWSNRKLYFDVGPIASGRLQIAHTINVGDVNIWGLISNANAPAKESIRKNGAIIGSRNAASSFTGANKDFFVGGNVDSAGDVVSGTEDNIAEVFIYLDNMAKSNTDIQKIESYLAIKYGSMLPASSNYLISSGDVVWNSARAGRYSHNVFGVGRDIASGLDQQISHSEKTGDVLTVSTDSNFIDRNGSHTSFSDGEFLMFSHDGGGLTSQTTDLDTTRYTERVTQEWMVRNTNSAPSVYLKFDGFDSRYVLLTDLDGDFSTTADQTNWGQLSSNGEIQAYFPDGTYFTLAKQIPQIEFISANFSSSDEGTNITGKIRVAGGELSSNGSVNIVLTNGTATGGIDYNGSQVTVSIPAGNYSTSTEIPFSIPVIQDSIDESNETINLSFGTKVGVIEADADRDGVNRNTAIATITDDDVAGITVSAISGDTTENGGTASFTIKLNTQPTDDVVIGLTTDDTTEGTVSPNSVTFTSTNWNTVQTVTVTGVDDTQVDGTILYHVVTSAATSVDSNYDGMNASDVSVSNIDNDSYSVSITKTTDGSEPSTNASFTISISPINSSGAAITGDIVYTGTATEGVDYGTGPTTFSIANGAGSVVISLNTIDDVQVEGVETVKAIISNLSEGSIATDNATANLSDDDVAGITVSAISGDTTEDGGTASFTIKLNTQPTDDVVIGLTTDDTTEGTVSPNSVTFTSTNWNTVQTVTVTGVDDTQVDGTILYHVVTSAATSVDSNYDGMNAGDVSVSNIDNDVSVSNVDNDVSSSHGGSGGSEAQGVQIGTCSLTGNMCQIRYPYPNGSNDTEYAEYTTCIIGKSQSGRHACAEAWAIAKGYTLCSSNNQCSRVIPEPETEVTNPETTENINETIEETEELNTEEDPAKLEKKFDPEVEKKEEFEIPRKIEEIKVCEPLLVDYLRKGKANNVSEVRKLQQFLRDYEGYGNLSDTGIFGDNTYKAVVSFQEKYASDVLAPWGITKGTGWVYKTTKKKINELYCEKEKILPKKEIVCEPYLKNYLKLGNNNPVSEVRKLQEFLKEKEGFENLKNTGIFGKQTHQAVVEFQEKYASDVLSPWGITKGTGWVYQTTLKKINELYCGK